MGGLNKDVMKKIIDRIRNGEWAILNNSSRKDLEEVLKVCFPKDIAPMSGEHKYYFACSLDINKWDYGYTTDLPTISVSDFLNKLNQAKEWEPKPGERVLAKDEGDTEWENVIFMGTIKQGTFPYCCCVPDFEEDYLRGKMVPYLQYNHVKKLEKRVLTIEEIAEKFGLHVDQIEISKEKPLKCCGMCMDNVDECVLNT